MGHREMIRVRVLFLEPGDLIHPSELDGALTEHCIREKRDIYGEDYADFNVYRINSAALADSIQMGDQLHCEIVSTPSDPCMEMLVPMAVVYFDLLEMNADWGGVAGGGVGDSLENCGVFETFGRDFETLVKHARTLTGLKTAHKDDWGTKVQFMTVYDYSSWTDYWGEWDCEHELVGYFHRGDINVRPFGQERPKSITEDIRDVLSDTDGMQEAQKEAAQIVATAQAESAKIIERMNSALR